MSMFPVDSECQCSPSRLARIHLALADPIRLRILALILVKESSPGQLSQVLGLSPKIIAKHLTYLRNGGVLSMRRQGKIVYYSVRSRTASAVSQLVHLTLDLLRLQPYMDGEFAALKVVREQAAERQNTENDPVSLWPQNDSPAGVNDLPASNEVPSAIGSHPPHST